MCIPIGKKQRVLGYICYFWDNSVILFTYFGLFWVYFGLVSRSLVLLTVLVCIPIEQAVVNWISMDFDQMLANVFTF